MAFDSPPSALEVQRQVWRRLGAGGRVLLAIQMSEEVRRICLAGRLARDQPRDTSDVVRVLYGVDLGQTRSPS